MAHNQSNTPESQSRLSYVEQLRVHDLGLAALRLDKAERASAAIMAATGVVAGEVVKD